MTIEQPGRARRERPLTDEAVIEWRRRVRKANGTVNLGNIAKRIGMSRESTRRMIHGLSYTDVPGAVPLTGLFRSTRRGWSKATIKAMRLDYASDETVTIASLRATYGGTVVNIRRALLGTSYKDVPGALDTLRPAGTRNALVRRKSAEKRRRFKPEVVLFMRLAYDPDKVSIAKIARAHRIHEKQAWDILNSKIYRDVPLGPMKPLRDGPSRRRFTEQQVITARAIFARGRKSAAQIARDLGTTYTVTNSMLRGRSYKHIPGAVTETIRDLVAKKRVPIKMPTVRLVDHDERVDLVAARQALREAA